MGQNAADPTNSTGSIDAVIWDVANVIVDWKGQRALKGLHPDDVVDAFFASEGWAAINHATDAGWTLAQAQAAFDEQHPEHAPLYRDYCTHFEKTVTGEEPGVPFLIRELIADGVPSFGLSNWARENFHVARRASTVLGELDDLIVSGEVGLAKPDPAIFELAITRFGVDRARTAFVDDNLKNVEAARAVGLRAFHFTGVDRLREELLPQLSVR